MQSGSPVFPILRVASIKSRFSRRFTEASDGGSEVILFETDIFLPNMDSS